MVKIGLIDLERECQIRECNARLRLAEALHGNSEERVHSLGLHLRSVRGAVESSRRGINYAKRMLALAVEKETMAEVELKIAVTIKEDMVDESDAGYGKIEENHHDIRVFRLLISLLGEPGEGGIVAAKITEAEEKIEDLDTRNDVLEQASEQKSSLAESFELGCISVRQALLSCAKRQKTTRIERLACLEDCLSALKSVEDSIEEKVEGATQLMEWRAERVRAIREELEALN